MEKEGKRHKKTFWRYWSLGIMVGAVLLFTVAALTYIFLLPGKWNNPLTFADLKEDNIQINSANVFVDELIKNDAMGADFGKKEYTLGKDIELSYNQVDTLCKNNLSFYGKLNGNGHKVTVTNHDLLLSVPLLSYVHADARLEYIEFDDWTVSVADGQVSAFIGTNEGVLRNIKLSNIALNIEQLYPGKESSETAIAALVVNNVGTIKNCVADVSVKVHNENISEPDFKCIIGGVVARNFTNGHIEDMILDVKYPDDLAALDTSKNLRRNDIGVIFGYGDAEYLKNIAIISDNLGIGRNAHDIFEMRSHAADDLYVVELAEVVQKFGTADPWRNNNWNNDNTWWLVDKSANSLPTLKPTNDEQ